MLPLRGRERSSADLEQPTGPLCRNEDPRSASGILDVCHSISVASAEQRAVLPSHDLAELFEKELVELKTCREGSLPTLSNGSMNVFPCCAVVGGCEGSSAIAYCTNSSPEVLKSKVDAFEHDIKVLLDERLVPRVLRIGQIVNTSNCATESVEFCDDRDEFCSLIGQRSFEFAERIGDIFGSFSLFDQSHAVSW